MFPPVVSFPKVEVDVQYRHYVHPTNTLRQKIANFVRAIFARIASFIRNIVVNHPKPSYKIASNLASAPKAVKDPIIVLAFDGGGVRGLVILAALKIMQEAINALGGNHIIKYVDAAAGVSTGGLITLALTTPDLPDNPNEPHFSVDQTIDLYKDLAERVFVKSRFNWGLFEAQYPSPKPVIESIIGNRPLATAVAKDVLVTSVDILTDQVVTFDKKSEGISFLDAALATSAAPTYFPSVMIGDRNCVDGGIATNNPAQFAALRALTEDADDRDVYVLSFGTGQLAGQPVTERRSVKWGLFGWGPYLIDYIMGASSSQVDQQLSDLAKYNKRFHYIRWQATITDPKMAKMDNASPENLQKLFDLGTQTFTRAWENGLRDCIMPLFAAKIAATRA